jgi:short-chain fatty acids transporter
MLRVLARPLVHVVERWMPDSLVFAIGLTFVVAGMALGLTDAGAVEILRGWGDGLAGLLSFIAQIAIVLVLGYTLAHVGPVKRILTGIASFPRSSAVSYGFVTVVAGVASLISWGLGLIVAGIMAREVARAGRRRGLSIHYPLLVAAGYSGFVVWHMGYSGSGPLAAATPGSFFEDLGPLVPVSKTIFAWWNLAAIAVTLTAVTAAMVMLAPRTGDRVIELEEEPLRDAGNGVPVAPRRESPKAREERSTREATDRRAPGHEEGRTPADRAETSRLLTFLLGLALVAYLGAYFADEGFDLTLDVVNWSFLAAILLLVRSPRELVGLIGEAGKTVGQILLQYPLYAGIIGMMTTTGLVKELSDFFVGISSPATLGFWGLISGGIINMFIPSGGGQFAVQAPIFMESARQLGVEPAPVIMAIAYGDQWTNMIQPFWTIPLLSVAGLRVRDIMGYTTITLLVSGLVFAVTLLLVGAG